MAIDKKSKAYQSLLNNGYTDDQIMQMYNETSQWKNIWETVGSTVPQNTKTSSANDGTIKVWPQNANLNYYQYWDDSNPAQQWQKGWMNEKYTWEWVSNTYIKYNPDLTVADLDPNYLYWENARQQNRKEAWYIARRNDNIASALYNEWLTSREDVANFLSQQNEWMNSTEADRMNTIESVWKRLWQIKPEPDLSKAEDIVQDTSGKIYWKTTAEEWNPKEWIDTLSDANSVFTAMEEARASNLKTLISISPEDIASALDNWLLPWDLQSIRDMQQYYPEIWEEVKQYQKKSKVQNEVDSITKWEQSDTSNAWQSVINNANAEFANKNASSIKSSQEITADVNNSLASNQTAQEASETMASIEEDMAILKNRLKNLRNEANAAFKWDVPDYLVNAYVANKTQEIQNQMKILEDRYNMAYKRYRDEVADTQWEKEYKLKESQIQLQKDAAAVDKWYKEQWIAIDWYKAKWWTTNPWDTYEVTTLTDEQVSEAVDELLNKFDNGQLWNAQCAAWIQRYYLPLIGIELPNLSSWENKKKLVNEWKDYIPKKWDLIIINSGAKLGDWTLAGHIGIVVWVTSDWYVQYLDWNGSLGKDWKWTEKVAMNSVSLKSSKVRWFRNINKSWWATSYGNREFTDADYNNFEAFLSTDKDTRLSKSDKEAMAEQYWFKDNLKWMTDFANEALKDRPESDWDTETSWDYGDEFWYDPEKWYNIYDTQLYQRFFAWGTNNSADKLAEAEWVPVNVFTNRARRWKAENKWAVDSMIAEWLNDSQKSILSQIVAWDIKLSNSNEKAYADALWLWWDVELLNQVIWEAYQLEWKKQLSEALRVAAELQLLFEDYDRVKSNWDFNTSFYMWAGYLSALWRKFDQLKNALKLDKVVSARWRWTTFGSMTEWEWEMLWKAVASLSIALDSDETFTKWFKQVVTDLWAAQYWEPWWEIVWPTTAEWDAYVKSVRQSSNFSISATNWWAKNNPPKPTTPNVPSWWTNTNTWSTTTGSKKESAKDWMK